MHDTATAIIITIIILVNFQKYMRAGDWKHYWSGHKVCTMRFLAILDLVFTHDHRYTCMHDCNHTPGADLGGGGEGGIMGVDDP